jgi:membrane protein YqaA with SNARE-associated domain
VPLVPAPTPSPGLLLQLLCPSLLAALSSGPLAPVSSLPLVGGLPGADPGALVFQLVAFVGAPLATLESAVEGLLRGATGIEGLLLIFVYSFLCAVVLPLPGELVLAVPLDLGWSPSGELAAVVAVASTAKAAGALVTLAVARGATTSGPVGHLLDVLPRPGGRASGGRTGRLARLTDRYGYLGLAGALSVPFAPDTAILYAFSVVDVRKPSFAAAAFVGTTLRLAIVAGVASALLALF